MAASSQKMPQDTPKHTSGQSNSSAGVGFSVGITASGCANPNAGEARLVHAVSVAQHVQSWTVLREHRDFMALSNALASIIPGLPRCPGPIQSKSSDDISWIRESQMSLHQWLNSLLLFQGVRETPAIRQFLCFGANMMPPEYHVVNWIPFSQPQMSQANEATVPRSGSNDVKRNTAGSLDEMEMDEMFYGGDGFEDDDVEGEGPDISDDEEAYEYSASVRYQATTEELSNEDIMEIQKQANEVEMVEDVGSLARSIGASHLGRSLQLQAQLASMKQSPKHSQKEYMQGQGLILDDIQNNNGKNGGSGGIGNAVEMAGIDAAGGAKVQGLGHSFHRETPVSPPRLDSFKMIKVIGKGSFGKVFLVREIKTGEIFALKVLRKDNIIKRNQVEHTRTERSVLGYVRHPFIVGLNMAFQSSDKLYFVLDYCAGGELFFHLGKIGKFPEHRACFYTAEIILAISYVHSLDIIYRDLKPENVLLDAQGHVRLTDFGLSKEGITNSSSGANSFCGTPEYLAPEILNRQGHGRAVDWWSLGALLYEMLTGLPPFYCRDREKLFEKIRKSELMYPRYLTSRSVGLLRGLLTRDPKKRLGSGPTDAEEIKPHPFFAEIDWKKLSSGEIPPPWNPKINNSLDTSQFDREFTSMPIFSPQSFQPHGGFGSTPQENVFEGFTFTDNKFYYPGKTE